jgi:hypothetical protein
MIFVILTNRVVHANWLLTSNCPVLSDLNSIQGRSNQGSWGLQPPPPNLLIIILFENHADLYHLNNIPLIIYHLNNIPATLSMTNRKE